MHRLSLLLMTLTLIALPAAAQNNNQGGILIDAEGVVTPLFPKAGSAKLIQQRMMAEAQARLPGDLNQPAESRKVSLVRLESAVQARLDAGQPIPDDMQFLAGLQRIDHIYFYPESNDIVIAGPAEGFAKDTLGRVRGVTSGRPPLRLEDVVVAIQNCKQGQTISCTIDPVPQNLANLQAYLKANSNATSVAGVRARFPQMARVLGMQTAKSGGVPENSRFALALIEADLRMKLISMGLEKVAVRGFRNHLSMLTRSGNSMQRWWFVPYYEELTQSADGLAFELKGQRAQLLAQEEIANAGGQRSKAATTRLSTEKYAQHFTEKFPELAQQVPAFAELQNLIDLAILSAILKKENALQKMNWEAKLFSATDNPLVAEYVVPRKVPSSFNYRMSGRTMILGLVGGGVSIDPFRVVGETSKGTDQDGKLAESYTTGQKDAYPEVHTWWWD